MDKYQIAKERYLCGDSIKTICSDLRIGSEIFSNKLKLDGVQIRGSRKPVPISQKKKEEILQLRKENKSIRDIGEIVGINRHKISFFLKTQEKDTCNLLLHRYHENIFNKIDTEEKAYWLGMLFADGHTSEHKNQTALTLQNEDKDHLEKFAQFIGGKVIKHSQNASRVSVSNKNVHKNLIEKGCINNKSLKLKVPGFDVVPIYLMNHFFRGYFDGDGHIKIITQSNGRTKSLVFNLMGTKEFLSKLREMLNIDLVIKPESKLGNVCDMRTTGTEKPLIIYDWIYKDSTIHLQRKYDIYKQFKHLISK